MSNYDTVNVEVADYVATVTLNRPEKKNCMSPALHAEMFDVMKNMDWKKVKVLVITGAGPSFCAGMDLEQCFLEPFDDPEAMEEINTNGFGWFTAIKSCPAVTIAKVNGWCFGGGWALNAALAEPADATVVYYGNVQKTKSQLESLSGPVLGHFAKRDKWINKEMVDAFRHEMEAARKPLTVHWYEAYHAFANPTGARYDEADAALSWERTLAFFKANLS